MLRAPDLIHSLGPLIWFGLAVFIAILSIVLIRTYTADWRRTVPDLPVDESARRRCRYCRRGTAVLREERVRLEGDDVVDVRCYVCIGCGLPQWWVERRHLAPGVR